jgi:ubiquinone/menaquinone biosynthesis C-methylase UbiE
MPSVRSRLLALLALAACASSSAAPPPEPAEVAPTPSAPAAPSAAAEPAPPPPAPGTEEDEHGHGVLHRDLNAIYEEQTDVETWQNRFERRSREVVARRDDVLAVLELRPKMAVADVGAGTGLYTFALAKAVGKSGRVYAVDVQRYFLEHLREQAKARKLPQIDVVEATQHAVGLPDASIDLALLCDAYHHIEHPQPYLESLFAAIRPGGRLVILDYRHDETTKKGFIREHIRASPEVFRAEIEAAGFRFDKEPPLRLEENFLFVFRRP